MKRTLVAMLGLAVVLAIGCSPTDLLSLLLPDLQGSWDSQVTNGDTATMTGCTGDLTALEGRTYNQSLANNMFCTVGGSLDVLQIDETIAVSPQTVACDDGSLALVTGTGTIGETTVSGQFQGVVGLVNGVTTVNVFNGSVSGNTLSVQQSFVVVSGGSTGSCNFTPPLATTITVN